MVRRLSINDELATVMTLADTSSLFGLDDRTAALVRVAALIASESASATYQWAIDRAIVAGGTEEDVIDVLLAVAPVVGPARVTSAAPEVALALGYDIEPPEAGDARPLRPAQP
jgi:alkylhydroperoxidase/carboxymuconolactone decarboxylase family protein YurZ